MAGSISAYRRYQATLSNVVTPTYIGGLVTLAGVPVSRRIMAVAFPTMTVDAITTSDPATGHYQFDRLVKGQQYWIVPVSNEHNSVRVDTMSAYGVDEYDIELAPSGSGGGVPGYTLRTGDALLVVDEAGKVVGLLPD